MTITNFSIGTDFASILYEGKNLDLHNDFYFADFNYDPKNKTAELIFKILPSDLIAKLDAIDLKFHFDNVTSVYTKDHDEEYPIEYIEHDGGTIDLLGFSFEGDEIMDGPTDINPRNDLPSLIFVFFTGKSIKITAETAWLVLN